MPVSATAKTRMTVSVGVVLVAACAVCVIGFGIRSALGLFNAPVSVAHQWSREVYAMGLAIQYLLWGVFMPVAGALADRYGERCVFIFGVLCYVAGLIGTSLASTPLMFYLTAGVLCGMGISGTSFTLAISAMVKIVEKDSRSKIMGIGTAAASLGQVIFAPLAQFFIDSWGWQAALVGLGFVCMLIVPAALLLPGVMTARGGGQQQDLRIMETVGRAFRYPSFIFLVFGFFICGFHVAFVALHLPVWLQDMGMPASVGAAALACIGLFNIIGSYMAGLYGQKPRKRRGLIFIYAARAVLIACLPLMPREPWMMLIFASFWGLLWLSTVPLTSGLVMQMYGVRCLATLTGIVMVGHQAGSFLG
ncbi:MAG: MFS transporter, partial [Candidatus Eutrophobiaceae bacterium]